MVKYLYKSFIFALPFAAYIAFILIIDPYNFANVFHVISDENKFAIVNRNDESSPRGNLLWKAIQIIRNPVKNILIGDSQGKDINVDTIEALCGEKVFNFCVPGASFETMFEMFWFAAEHNKLEKVYFQVSFMNYNSYRSYNIYHFAQYYFDHPYRYYLNKPIFFDACANLKYHITRNPKIIQGSYEFQPIEEINKLAKSRLNLFFQNYTYPHAYFRELNNISKYCEENNIELKFIIFPVYKLVDEYLAENNLLDMKQRFKDDIKFIGDTYDLDVPGEIKNNRENYFDYFHPRQAVLDEITTQIWCRE
jgi:hypothetical protein